MGVGHIADPLLQQIAAVRDFNRFYTARLGLLRRRHLGGEFPLTEARLLYEIGAKPLTTATALRAILELDAGYLSHLLAALSRRRLIRQVTSREDAREKHLTLTAGGRRAVDRINRQSDAQMREIFEVIGAKDREALVASLETARRILTAPAGPAVGIERVRRATPEALAILAEYYEAVRVLQRDTPSTIRKLLREPDSGMWLARLGGDAVGCVVLRRLASIPRAAECKRLYVKPSARGHGIGNRLLDATEDFARSQGVEWIYLDSYDDLKTAIALYERRGYERCARYNDNPQATLFMRRRLP
ncbi:MAG TPA: helix-turn-helix domain-containing GNAT family N-acetyltransferase [Terracidiphilus sp.]|nr:helix-turn-helix domain-containing GNAT family N-acetyltransferase [Terracidiphilus sp.]